MCVSLPQIHMETPYPRQWDKDTGAFRRCLGHKDWSPMNGISALIKWSPKSSLPCEGHSEIGICHRKRPHQDPSTLKPRSRASSLQSHEKQTCVACKPQSAVLCPSSQLAASSLSARKHSVCKRLRTALGQVPGPSRLLPRHTHTHTAHTFRCGLTEETQARKSLPRIGHKVPVVPAGHFRDCFP